MVLKAINQHLNDNGIETAIQLNELSHIRIYRKNQIRVAAWLTVEDDIIDLEEPSTITHHKHTHFNLSDPTVIPKVTRAIKIILNQQPTHH